MTVHDREGFELTGATAEARDLFERALDLQHCYLGDPLEAMDRAIVAAPGFAMAHIAHGWMNLIGTEPQGFVRARESHNRAVGLAATARERAHLAALGQLAAGHFHDAAATLQRVSIDHPRDLLALQIGHHVDFFVGDARMMRDRVARALPAWREDRPGYHLLPAMHAFGLEECGDYAFAEREGRRAAALHPGDSWAQHAVAHVMEMQGRLKEGLAWMRDDPELWSRDSLLAIHNWWHTALYHLELGEIDEVLALYDGPIFGAQPPFVLPLGDAAAMLWRLMLRGVDVGGRWAVLADLWSGVGGQSLYAFNDAHAVMAYVGAGRPAKVAQTLAALEEAAAEDSSNAVFAGEVALPVARAFAAFGEGDHARAAALLLPVIPIANRFGGSHAQRDVLDLTLIEAAFRAGDPALARALTAQRRAIRPASPFADALFRQAWRVDGERHG